MTAIKICGITRQVDAERAAALGAEFVGFVLWPHSPRAATLDVVRTVTRALPSAVTPVGVFVDPSADEILAARDAGIRVAQIHGEIPMWGDAPPAIPVIRAVHLGAHEGIEPNVPDDLVLLDAQDPVKRGGTGKTVDWPRAATVARGRRIILAGGLTPSNVQQAISAVRPYGVDVASGVEERPGIKDHALLRAFITAAKGQ
jgi:phosphoribosylanthranilate isomerase